MMNDQLEKILFNPSVGKIATIIIGLAFIWILIKLIQRNFESELAISYQKRFIKYKAKLFLFLYHDGIPWNNNNAEHSIKPFAKWRKKISKSLTKKNIEHHLILLSVLQTCKYQEVNFFEFLKSGKKSIYNLSDN